MSNVSERKVIREMGADELEKLYAALHVDYYSHRNQLSTQAAFNRRSILLDKMDEINKYYFQLTHKNINND